jgi:hypothetical protein
MDYVHMIRACYQTDQSFLSPPVPWVGLQWKAQYSRNDKWKHVYFLLGRHFYMYHYIHFLVFFSSVSIAVLYPLAD